MDLTDDSLKENTKSSSKNVCERNFGSLNLIRKPKLPFDNNYKYGEMLVEKNIIVYSTCENIIYYQ
jgi:GTP cyclohydrolase I